MLLETAAPAPVQQPTCDARACYAEGAAHDSDSGRVAGGT